MSNDSAEAKRRADDTSNRREDETGSIMATAELRQLLDPADELIKALSENSEEAHATTITEIPRRLFQDDLAREPARVDAQLEVKRESCGDPGFDPYNRT